MRGKAEEAKPDYEVDVSNLPDDPEWDAFVESTPGGHHVQTSRWGRVKSVLGWKATRVSVKARGGIAGGAQLLFRSWPLLGSAGYVTKGPLCLDDNIEVAGIVLREIVEAAGRNRCRLLAVQPPVNGNYLAPLLEASGFCTSSLELGPVASVIIDLRDGPENVIKQMRRETRHHIHRSERRGITVREGKGCDLDLFYPLYLCTAKRQRFTPYNKKYLDTLWQVLSPPGWIAMLTASYGDEPVSAQLLVAFGDIVIAKMVGWSGKYSSLRPNDALFWASILWASSHGYKFFDFEGVDPSGARMILKGDKFPDVPTSSHDIIKYGYGGKIVLFPSVYDLVPNCVLNWAYRRVPRMGESHPAFRCLLDYFRKR